MAKEYEVGVEFSAKDNASEKIKKIQDTFMKCEKIIEKGQKMQAFGQRLGLTSAVIGSAAVSANNFISSMKEPYMEVEESLLALSTVTTTTMGGMDKSMEMTKQKAIAWSKAHRESANQYIQTAYQMASAGLNDVQAIAATETAMRTARATMGDSADAAALIAVAYNNMGDKTKDAASEIGKFGDVISKTQQLFQIKNLNQLSEGLKNAVPSALQFGQSFEELNVAIGVLNNAGVTGSVAGTAYAAAMRQMNKASKDLGITLARNSQGGIDFIGTLENINQKSGDFKSMAPEVQEKFKQAFGDEGLRTISLLASKTADMREKLKAVQNSKGTAETSQKTLESSEAAKLEIAANRLQAIKINFAERLMKSDAVIKEIIPKMGQLVEKIADMAAGFMNAHPEIAATIAVLLVGGAAVMTLAAPFLMVSAAVVSFAGTCVSGFGRAFKAVQEFRLYVADGGLRNSFNRITDTAGNALNRTKDYFVRAGNAAKDFGKKVADAGRAAWDHLTNAAKAARDLAVDMLKAAKNSAVQLADNLKKAAGAAKDFGLKIWEAGKKAAIAAATGLKSAAKGVMAFAKQAWSAAATALPKLIAATWQWTVALLTNPVTWIVLAIVAAVALLIYYWDDLKAAGIAAWNYLSEAAGNAWNSFNGIIDGMIASAVQFGQSLWNTFAETFPGLASFIDSMQSTFETSGAALWDAFCNGIRSVLSKPAELVQEGLQMVRNLLPFSDAKEGPLSQLTRSGRAVLSTIAEGVPGSYGKLQAAVATGFEGIDLSPELPVKPDWGLDGVPSIPDVMMEPALNMDALQSIMPVQLDAGQGLAELPSVPKVPMEAYWYIDPLAKMPDMTQRGMAPTEVRGADFMPEKPDWDMQDLLAKVPDMAQWGMVPAWMQGTDFMPEKPDWNMQDPLELIQPRREQQPQQAVQIQKEGRKIIIYGDIHIQAQQMNNATDFLEALRVIADSEGDGDAD